MYTNWLNYHILPLTCSVGLIFEFFSLTTFYKINKSKCSRNYTIYYYLFIYSISDTIILSIFILYGILKCGKYCLIGSLVDDYLIQQYEKIFKIYLCNSFYTFNVLIESKIAYSRYRTMSQFKNFTNKSRMQSMANSRLKMLSSHEFFILFLLISSFSINIPYLYLYKIEKSSPAEDQHLNSSLLLEALLVQPDMLRINNNSHLKPIAYLYFVKDFVLLTIVCILNIMVTMSFRRNKFQTGFIKFSQKNHSIDQRFTHDSNKLKSKINQLTSKEKKISTMIMILCISFFVGHLPETFYKLKKKLSYTKKTRMNLDFYLFVSNIISCMTSYLNFLIYLYFSPTFRRQFKKNVYTCLNKKKSQG
ncbi:hypothetical protein BpHYR1_014241 [Brachionus plicatilis]|uniref:G-protein coupled receptors family 1 profile domain-containing protein n=1 Tax=Brachionus plicatilis TaxID=10195 RepID=A0A3M7SCG7_BRAPC|nr:hypothetical protein BpHYR1_014241 [Brachionus plicatilis]